MDPEAGAQLCLWLTLGLKFERFGGEPDGGVVWVEEKIPFVFLEVSGSDTKIESDTGYSKRRGTQVSPVNLWSLFGEDLALPCQ
jgi:hypothetical protein